MEPQHPWLAQNLRMRVLPTFHFYLFIAEIILLLFDPLREILGTYITINFA